MASRGSREGNNAFMKTEHSVSYDETEFIEDFLEYNSNPALLEAIEQFFEKKKLNIYENIFSVKNVHDLLMSGHPEIAGKVIQACLKNDSRALIPLFRDVLLFSNEELTGCSPSNLRFVSRTVHKLSVFHCAAANKNSKYLEKLLSIQPEVHIADRKGNRPIHYAAACQSPDNLKVLFEKGANLHDKNSSHKLPLHIAIKNNRPLNVEFLLDMASKNPSRDPLSSKYGVGSVNYRDYTGKTPLHLTAEYGFLEIAEILLKFGAQVNAQLGVSDNKLTPLMCAAGQGSLKMVQLLVQHGADVEQKDRMDRRAVIHACMNGSTSVLSYLLNIGASAEEPDSSGNSPLHYAAAYGWYFTVNLLLEAGVDPNASNMWKITPVSVAYLKSQVGIVQLLLNHEKVDINFSDDNGKNLIFHACESDLLQPDLAEQIKYIIEKKGALCDIKDNNDRTPLHCLALNQVNVDNADKATKETANIQSEGFKQSIAIAELLIKHGCDPKAVDQNNNTAAMLAISNVTNLPLCEYLLNKGSPVLFPSGSKPTTTVLHEIADSIWSAPLNLEKLLQLLIKYNYLDDLKLMARYVDSLGFTPLHTACYTAKETKHRNHDNIENRKLLKENWDHIRGFIRILVDKLGSDVNAKIQKKHFEEDEMPSPNSDRWWFQKQIAGRTAAHIIMLDNDPAFDDEFKIIPPGCSGQVFKDLVLRGTNINVLDENGCSPLATCIYADRSDLFEFMATQGKCDFNQKVKSDNHMINPLIIAANSFCNIAKYDKKSATVICKLMDFGCDINCETVDTKKKILHCVANQPDSVVREEVLRIVTKLAEKGYNFNSLDGKQRTGLHYALRANNGGLNQSFELEVRLIQQGTNLGLKDKHGRTALQYIFNKSKKVNRNACVANNDPAELTKLIGRNMTKQQINGKDKHGQTVLHQAARQGATVCCMYLTLVGADVNLEDNNGNTALSLAVQNKHDGCATTLIQSGANLKSKIVIISPNEVMKRKVDKQTTEESNKEVWHWQPNTLVKVNEPVRVISLYQAAIEYDLPGVAMFVTEAEPAKSGLTLQDAITIADFLLKAGFSATEGDEYNCNPIMYTVLNRCFSLADFLAKKSAGYDVKYTDNFNRSYLAAALWRCHSGRIDMECWNFIAKLVEAKFSLNQYFDLPLNPDLATIVKSNQKQDPDYWQSYPQVKTTALFAAICCADFTIAQELLVKGANPNITDESNLTPLMYAIKLGHTNHVRLLLNYDYDPKKSYTPNKEATNVTKKIWPKKPRTMFNLTATIGESVESSESSDEDLESEEEESEDDSDDDFFTMEKTSSVNLHAKDGNGCIALHYVAQTHPNGTFDNPEAAFVLVRGGAKLKKDNSGLNPYQLALKSGAHKVAEVIRKHFKLPQEQPPARFIEEQVNDGVPEEFENWPDFKEPAEKVLRRYDSSCVLEDVYLHEVDSNCNIKDGELLKDETLDVYYDVLMTKVDVKQGLWGLYNFYQMQIVSQPKKSLFILFTRWGRIEDNGQFQHTPYVTKEEAVKEFMKIFRQKSGNKWSDVKNFEKKDNRYRLIEDAARKAPLPQKDVDFNLESNLPSRMPKHLYKLVETLMNPKAMELTASKPGGKNFTLALGQLNKELLIKGKDLLDQLEKLVDEVEAYRKLPKDDREDSVNKSKYQNNLEKISELSNEYFHVIPTKNFSCEKIRPLDQKKNLVVQISNLNNMLNYEISSKMLLASMHYKSEYNPVDYVYRSVGCKIELMSPIDEMSQMILKYISIGSSDCKVHGIYKLNRKGESQRLKANGLGDHRLLWHGTKIGNLLSILNRGLVICPPEADRTGWAYGKGIYFSDAFGTSANYITTKGFSSFMLLCEVALGEKLYYNTTEKEDMDQPHNSVVVQNYSAFFYSSEWFHLPSGICLPQNCLKSISTYNYNTQYVILDPAQVCLRYLVEFSK
ncbi:hypothetical protein Btru_040138 [Bulinus truncatus]|nr:hypothetical protein Btru_040138 [Bulinus truncatus]